VKDSNDRGNLVEQVGPQARIQDELLRLESRQRETWVLIPFAAAVLLLGFLSLLTPSSFWQSNQLEIRFSPQVLFVVMIGMVVVLLLMMRRDLEEKRLRLGNLQQSLAARSEQAASMIDAITNVFTRSFLKDLMQGEISRAERAGRPLSVLMCDLNNFKAVNDRYGHLMGDYVLSQVALILKSCVRGSDYIIRYGGDEFLVLLPETDEKGGDIVRTRIHQKMAEWDRTNRVGDLPISLSLGLFLHAQGQTGEQDIAEADARMYAAKQASKANGVASAVAKA
jgi:diguanylate cyclase (GGDEF)-like protein